MFRILRQQRALFCAVKVGFVCALAATHVSAQTADSANHSPNSAQQDAPVGAPTDSEDAPGAPGGLPPGHPHIDSGAVTGDTGMPGARLAQDTVNYSASIPAGTVEIHILDAEEHPVANASVIVQLHRESISEGNTESRKEAVSDANGVARVERLLTDSAVSYRVKLSDGGVTYGMQPFQLNEHAGTLVTMHKYPIARDLKRAMVAMQSLVFVEPKDDVFQFEVVYDLYNLGKTTWVPEGLNLRLPNRWKAFNAQQSADDVRVESLDDGVRITGAVPPGQHQITYTFQVPRENTSNANFEIDLPPNTMMAKVGLASGRRSELTVEGFADPEPMANQNGQRMLVAAKTFDRSVQMPTEIKFEVRGLPTVGPGRIVAGIIAFALAAVGLFMGLTRRGRSKAAKQAHSLQDRARERLIEELTILESAKVGGRIGPLTYEETRRTLVEALVRLEPVSD